MTPLQEKLIDIIRRDGPISIERYMALCLGDPDHGYYMTRDPLGARGDFTTSPEISQMFGELIGVWAAAAWRAMGEPSEVSVVELGPGRGTLMRDAMRAFRVAPGLSKAARIRLVETSPVLRERQRATLRDAPSPIVWDDNLDAVPAGPLIVLANEFFDALPIRQFMKAETGWRERLVSSGDDGAFAFALTRDAAPIDRDAPNGAICETSPATDAILQEICRRISAWSGAALIIDYGYADDGLGDTLQAMREHQFVNPLRDPGDADLTAHVNFAAVRRLAQTSGVAVQGPITQAAFLRAMGIDARASALAARADERQRSDIQAAHARLTDESDHRGMGALFKAIALRNPHLPPMPGFDGGASPS